MKSKIIILTALLCAPVFMAGQCNIEKARQAVEADSMDVAIQCANEELKLYPKCADAYAIRGVATSFTNANNAITDFTEALKLVKKGGYYTKQQLYVLRGKTYQNIGEQNKALSDYTAAIKCDKTGYLPYRIRGTLLYEMGRYDEAIKDFNRSIDINPIYADAYREMARCYFMEGDIDNCIKNIDIAIRYNPELAESYTIRVLAKCQKGQYKEALDDIYKYYGYCSQCGYHDLFKELSIKEFQHSLSVVSSLIQSDSDNLNWRVLRSDVYYFMDMYEESIADMTVIINQLGNDPGWLKDRAWCYYKNEEYDNAVKDATMALENGSSYSKECYNIRYLSYFRSGHLDKAERDCSELISIDPSDVSYYFLRGKIKMYKKQYKEAVLDFNMGLALDSTDISLYYNRGKCYKLMGDSVNSIKDFNQVLEIDTIPSLNSERHYVLAYLGKTEEAVDWLDKCVLFTMVEDNLSQGKKLMDDAMYSYLYARLYAALGNVDKSIDYLITLCKNGTKKFWTNILYNSDWDSIRSDKRYEGMVQEYKLQKLKDILNSINSK